MGDSLEQSRYCGHGGDYCYLYYVAFAAFCFCRTISYINVDQFTIIYVDDLVTVAKLVMLLGLVSKLLLQRYDLKSLILIGFCLLVLLLSSRTSFSKQLLWFFLFVCAAQGVKIKMLARICLWFYAVTLIVGVSGWFVGEIEAIEALRFDSEGIRSSLGFRHPNSFGYIAMTVCFSLLVLRFPDLRMRDFLLTAGVAVAVNVVAGSRTSFIAIILGVIIAAVYGHFCKTERARKLFAVSSASALIMLFAASLALMVCYDPENEVLVELNRLLSSRLSYASYYFQNYSLSLFGSNIPQSLLMNTTDATVGFVVDNAFCNLCLRYGIVPAVLFVGTWVGIYIKAFMSGYRGACILALTLWIVVAFAESTVLTFVSNFGFVAAASLLYGYPLASLDGERAAGQKPQGL